MTRVLLAILAALALPAGAALAQRPALTEPQIKASYIYNFVQFVGWPAQAVPGNTITVGVLGSSPVGAALDTINGKPVGQRTFMVRHLGSPREGGGVQILFLSDAERGRLPQVLQAVGNASVLTVGETPGFAAAGCAIDFVRQGTKVRFQINQEAAARQRLTLSSQLLRLALIVRGAGR
jgi:hypothetical protein